MNGPKMLTHFVGDLIVLGRRMTKPTTERVSSRNYKAICLGCGELEFLVNEKVCKRCQDGIRKELRAPK